MIFSRRYDNAPHLFVYNTWANRLHKILYVVCAGQEKKNIFLASANFSDKYFTFITANIILIIMNLYKSNENRMIAGVCGGLAEKYFWDPSLVRIAAVLLTVLTGFWLGILGYIAAWIIIPDGSRKP